MAGQGQRAHPNANDSNRFRHNVVSRGSRNPNAWLTTISLIPETTSA
jgi:hypothetical protein